MKKFLVFYDVLGHETQIAFQAYDAIIRGGKLVLYGAPRHRTKIVIGGLRDARVVNASEGQDGN